MRWHKLCNENVMSCADAVSELGSFFWRFQHLRNWDGSLHSVESHLYWCLAVVSFARDTVIFHLSWECVRMCAARSMPSSCTWCPSLWKNDSGCPRGHHLFPPPPRHRRMVNCLSREEIHFVTNAVLVRNAFFCGFAFFCSFFVELAVLKRVAFFFRFFQEFFFFF